MLTTNTLAYSYTEKSFKTLTRGQENYIEMYKEMLQFKMILLARNRTGSSYGPA
jgi:hypothetical protein